MDLLAVIVVALVWVFLGFPAAVGAFLFILFVYGAAGWYQDREARRTSTYRWIR